jgi:hypothetical protein
VTRDRNPRAEKGNLKMICFFVFSNRFCETANSIECSSVVLRYKEARLQGEKFFVRKKRAKSM